MIMKLKDSHTANFYFVLCMLTLVIVAVVVHANMHSCFVVCCLIIDYQLFL